MPRKPFPWVGLAAAGVAAVAVLLACGPGSQQQLEDCIGLTVNRAAAGGNLAGSVREGAWSAGDGGVLSAAKTVTGGRFVIFFEGPVASGDLPRMIPPENCYVQDFAFFHPADAGTFNASCKVNVLAAGRSPGEAVDLDITSVVYELANGRKVAAPDLRITATVAPPP